MKDKEQGWTDQQTAAVPVSAILVALHASGQWTAGAPVGAQVTRNLASCEYCGSTNYHRGDCDRCGMPL